MEQSSTSSATLGFSGAIRTILCGAALVSASLLAVGRSTYPELHLILDTGLAVLSGVLALFFWSVGRRLRQRFPLWIAATLGVTWILDAVHLAITVEWSGPTGSGRMGLNSPLMPATWALPTYILPVGVGCSLWLLRKNSRLRARGLAAALLGVSASIIAASFLLPRYLPSSLGVIRSTLVMTPMLWVVVGALCWRWREAARTLPGFALMSILLALGDFAMLFSQAPDDTASILAHLGKALGSLVVLMSKMQMASNDLVERELAESKFRGLLENAPDAIVVVNGKGKIALLNAQAETLFGYRREALLGHEIDRLIPARFHHAHPSHMAGFFSSPHARPMGKGFDLFGMRHDGSEFPVEISLSPLQTEEGLLVSAAIRDVTQHKHAENEIRRLNYSLEERAEELTAANHELEAFTYTAAHDLRAPLRHLHGYTTFLKEAWYERLDEEGRHYLDRIMSSTKAMAALLDDLLNFSRLGRVEMQTHDVNLAGIVARIREDLHSDPDYERVTWQVGELPVVKGDLSLLHQVLFNLISNALKYSRKAAGPEIAIDSQVDAKSGRVTLSVRDNGAGFDMQYSNKLFQVFQRLHRSKEFEGTGIGLAIVRRIVERHGGRVWAEGAVGKGATFHFSLPLRSHDHGQTRVHSAGR